MIEAMLPDGFTGVTDRSFERDAERVMVRLRAALSGVVARLPGSPQRPQDLTRALGIDKKLGWKIGSLVQASDVFEAARHIPGKAGLRKFLDAARGVDVPYALIEDVIRAEQEYERLVSVHAGDRASLEMMLSGVSAQGRERLDLDYRRLAFRANSYIWGIQASTQFRAYFLHASADDSDTIDVASVRGFVGLRRIRREVRWAIHQARIVDDDGVQRRSVLAEPLEPGDQDVGDGLDVPLMRSFCTTPLPQTRRVQARRGYVHHELVEGQVGNTARATCVLGDVVRGSAPRYREEHNECVELVMRANTPCETLVFDQLVHEGLFGGFRPQLAVYGELGGETPPRFAAEGRVTLPVVERVVYLGRGPGALHVPEIPRYSELVQRVFERTGWDGSAFEAYRVKMVFPPIPAAVVVSTDLGDRPA